MKPGLACVLIGLLAGMPVAAVENPIRLNSVGFLPGQVKQASLAAPGTNFSVIRVSDGAVVFSGKAGGPRTNADTGEALFTADFSAVTNAGTFQIEVAGLGRSPAFGIGVDVYQQPYVVAMRAFYLWRCGTAVRGTNDGRVFAHAACHTNDAWLDFATGQHERRLSTGGWHDAGDYNKYVVNAGVAVGVLLRAWEDFGPQLGRIPLQLPEAGGRLPEFLAEIKWELDWLFTMQVTNGAVYHKVSTVSFGPFIKPEEETAPRYFAPWSTEATANFVGIMAAAARAFEPYDAVYAKRCRDAANRSYDFLVAHPERQKSDQSKFATGTYAVGDDGARLWAAAEMWQLIGRAGCLMDFEKRLRATPVPMPVTWDYYNPGPLGCVTYLFSTRAGRDAALVSLLQSNLQATAGRMVVAARAHGYARPNAVGYGWGFNGQVARQAVLLHAANRMAPGPEYFQTAADGAGFLLGRNVLGRSYVTGLGHQPPLHPHDRCSASDSVAGPWPGFLVGGPHPAPRDWFDELEDYRTNEIAINWNAALVYLLAWLGSSPAQTAF
jgi:endoglucanase